MKIIELKYRYPMKTFEHETDRIFYLEADINYTKVHYTDGSSALSSNTLKRHEEVLVGYNFLRINRKQLVNTAYILSTERMKKHLHIQLKNGISLQSSRRKIDILNLVSDVV
jgi:two-component system, LytTR family, response regulator